MTKIINFYSAIYNIFSHIKPAVWIAGLFLIVVIPSILVILLNPKKTEAGWYDDGFQFRQQISFTHNADITSPRRVEITIDTAALTTDKMQADCDDTRFTDLNGKVLKFQLVSGCDSATTVYHVEFLSVINGSNLGYVYYGNPSAASASENISNTTSLTPSGSPSFATEENGPGPMAYWKFDEGVDNTCQDGTSDGCDDSSNRIHLARTSAVWQTEDKCISGKCAYYDGDTDYFSAGDVSAFDFTANEDFTVSAWIRPTAVSGDYYIISKGALEAVDGDPANSGFFVRITAANIVASVRDQTSQTRLNAIGNIDLEPNKWYHIAAVFDRDGNLTIYIDGKQDVSTNISATNASLGNTYPLIIGAQSNSTTSREFPGYIDDVKVYGYARSATQIKADVAGKGTTNGVAASFGEPNQNFLTNGLVGHWKMDETSWTNDCSTTSVADNSGNSNNGRACPASTGPTGGGTGKFGTGATLDGSNDYLSIPASSSTNNLVDGKMTFSAWIYTTAAATTQRIWTKRNNYIQVYNSSGNKIRASVFNSADNISATTLSTNTWYHLTVTYDDEGDRRTHIYINGVEDSYSSITNGGGAVQDDSGFATEISTSSSPFTGNIDDVRIFNRILSPSEIQSLYNWAPGPMGYWPLDEKASSTLYDKSGNGNNLSITGSSAQFVPGKFGGGIRNPDKSDIVANLGPSSAFEVSSTGSVTYSSWFYFEENSNFDDSGVIVGRGNCCGASEIVLRLTNAELLRLELIDDNSSGNDTYTITGSTTFIPNRWYHVAGVFDRSSETNSTLYVNGVKETVTRSGTFSSLGSFTDDPHMLILSGYYGMKGIVDEFKIYNYARSSSQIIEDMNGGHPVGGSPISSKLVDLDFDETYGTIVHDTSGNGYHGTISTGGNRTATWTKNGKTNSAIDFGGSDNDSGTNDYAFVEFADNAFDSLTEGSIAFWFKPDDSTEDTTQDMFTANVTGGGFASTFTLDFDPSNNRVVFWTNGCTTETDHEGYFPIPTTVTNWHHLVYSEGTSGHTFYLDGIPVTPTYTAGNTSGTCFFDEISTGTTHYAIGNAKVASSQGYEAESYHGLIDTFQIYSTPLTAEQVKIIYNANASINFGSTASSEESIVIDGADNPPVGYWNVDEKTGVTANDRSGNGFSGTLTNGPTWDTGKIGSAVRFADADDYITISDSDNFSPSVSDGFTAEAWIYQTSATGARDWIVTKGASSNYEWGLAVNIGQLYCESWDLSGSSHLQISTGTVPLNTWQHVACTINPDNEMRLYLNGVLLATDTSAGGSMGNGTAAVRIGDRADGNDNNFAGKIDEVKVYNYVRTPAQVAYDYNRGAPVGYWQFDDCTGPTARDASGNNVHLTIVPQSTDNTAVGTCGSGTGTHMWNDGTTGRFNASLGFDGDDDYASVANPTIDDFGTGPMSVSVWVKTTMTTLTELVDNKRAGNNDAGFNIGVNISAGNGRTMFRIANGSSQISIGSSTDDSIVNDGQWHHLVGVLSRGASNDALYLYKDGKLVASNTALTAGWNISSSTPIYFGAYGSTAGEGNLDGQLDDVRLFNYDLSASQVQKLYTDNASVRFGPATGSP